MSVFDHKRLDNDVFKLDVERMRKGWYSDKYFVNISLMLSALDREGYTFLGEAPEQLKSVDLDRLEPGDLEVEMQWFTRHSGKTLIVGVDKALTMLKECTGYFNGNEFVNTADRLQVWAIEDGACVHYNGDPMEVQPVMRVRGRYRDFAILETPMLGILTRASRVATNVYETLVAANGKPVLVAYWFKHDRTRILERFPAEQLDGEDSIRRWNAGEIPLALIHPASAGHGLNLQSGGSTLIWFSLTWSLELYQQTNARLWRQGQKETVVIYHLVAKGTIDEDVMEALAKKDAGQAALLQAVQAKVGRNEQ